MKTISDIRSDAIQLLSSSDIETPILVVDILLTFLLDYPSLHTMRCDISLPFPQEKYHNFSSFIQRVLQKEPIAYIIGKKYFLDFVFTVSSSTLIPRPETEELVEHVLEDITSFDNATILDIGTGSGCIACSLALYRPQVYIVALDISRDALDIAYANACTYDITSIHFVQGDLYTLPFQADSFTHIIANPPYLSYGEYTYLDKSVKDFEPYHALVGGEIGIEAIIGVLESSYVLLQQQGTLYIEIGHLQKQLLEEYLTTMQWTSYIFKKDLSHKYRFLIVKK